MHPPPTCPSCPRACPPQHPPHRSTHALDLPYPHLFDCNCVPTLSYRINAALLLVKCSPPDMTGKHNT